MDKLSRFLDTLKLFGFAIVNLENVEVIDTLKHFGLLQFFRVHKLGEYTVLEVSSEVCERECNLGCRNDNGKRIGECYGECIDKCITERLKSIIETASRMFSTRVSH